MNKVILGCIVLLCNVSAALAGDAPAKAQACVACHGDKGVSSNPEWPNLAGQKAGYLAIQLTAFRDGTRSNPAMAPFVAGLSDADIKELAAFYASQTLAISASGDHALRAAGEHLSAYCKACHGMRGVPITNEWPTIAGQQAPYLKKQLQAFKAGQRSSPQMQTVVHPMGDGEFAALAAYYSSLKP